MNDFLNQVWGNNPVKHYFIVVAIILFVWLLKKFISRYLAALLFKIVHKIWKNVDKASFVNLIFQPIGLFLLILVSIVSLHKLYFPPDLNIDLYGYSTRQIIHCIGNIVLIISFIWLLLRIIDFVAMILKRKAEKTSDLSDDQLVVFFRDFFKVIIVIMGIMMVLNFAFKLNVGSLITGLSIVGAAIALALRESLENLIASFVIFFDKPFTTGDLVKVNNVTGTVEKIGMRSTRIRSDYKTYVSVPNKQMVDSVLDNLSLRTQRRGDIRLELSLQASHIDVLNIINALKKILTRDKIINFNVLVSEITGQAIVISADYYSINFSLAEFNELKEAVNLDSLKLLETSKVEIAGSNMDVRVKN